MESQLQDMAKSLPEVKMELQSVEYLPSSKDSLLITWIGAQLDCVASRKGAVVSDLQSHSACRSLEDFAKALAQVVSSLGFIGRSAELMLDGGPLESVSQTLPPGSPRRQDQYLREKVRRLQSEKGSLVWESQPMSDSKAGQKALLHSVSKVQFDELEACFAQHGITLKKALPFLAVASRAFRDIRPTGDSASVLLCPAGSGFKIIALDRHCELQFARELNKENGSDAQRVATEINRCILYARQQFGKPISQIVIVGMQAARFKARIRAILQGDIPIAYRSANKDLWLAQLAISQTCNLAKENLVQERRQRMRKAGAAAAFLAAGAALFAFGYQAELDRQKVALQLRQIQTDEAALRESLETLSGIEAEAFRMRSFVEQIDRGGRPPIERALVGFLGRSLPPDTWVEELETIWMEELSGWQIRLSLQTETVGPIRNSRKASLERLLIESPFALNLKPPGQGALGSISLGDRDGGLEPIVIEGLIALRATPNPPS